MSPLQQREKVLTADMNPIPAFTTLGLLPAGIHQITRKQLREVFGYSNRREMLLDNLDLCLELMVDSGLAGVVLLDGSFVTDKEDPGDIDLTLDVHSCISEVQEAAVMFYHRNFQRLKATHIDWYPSLPNDSDFRAFFQYVGEKTAAVKQCDPKAKKGILKLASWK